jgi:hypothetical protein
MKDTFLFLICKNYNQKGFVNGIKINKNNKRIKFNKEECRELFLYLKLHYPIWSK